jgi:hypothetical protein
VTDLAGTQLSSLLETLPGIARVLRSPVADAFIGVIRAATGQGPFNVADAEEILRYAVRRNLVAAEESERVLAEAHAGMVQQAAAAKANAKLVKAAEVAKAKLQNTKKAAPVKKATKSTKTAKHPARKPVKPSLKKPANKK